MTRLVTASWVAAGLLAGSPFGRSSQIGFETMRIRGQILVEAGGPLAGARIKTDAIRGPAMVQFTAQREFTATTGRNGEWTLLGPTRGLWILEISARDHLPHVIVVPIALMLRPEPTPWDTSLALLPVSAIAPGTDATSSPRLIVEAADRAIAGDKTSARQALLQLTGSSLDASALCAAGDVAMLLREPAMARRFFELAATANEKWYRPHLGIASASIMNFDFDGAVKGYAAARANSDNKRLQRMLSAAIRDLQQIRSIGPNEALPAASVRRSDRKRVPSEAFTGDADNDGDQDVILCFRTDQIRAINALQATTHSLRLDGKLKDDTSFFGETDPQNPLKVKPKPK